MTYETNGLNGTGPIHFTNVRILDASGEYSYTGEVVVQGNRIKQITRGSSRLAPASGGHSDTIIDGMGATLMPGLIDAHLHLSWNNAPGIDPIQMMELEEHMLVTMEMAKLVLDAGFTAGRGAAAAKPRLDVVAKRFIDEANQRRNDLTEQCDVLLLKSLSRQNLPAPGAELHSESPGLILDRLSILSLKLFHTREEIDRPGAPAGHAARNVERLRILAEQRDDLAAALDRLWQQVLDGRRSFKLYRQLKMYNDPALNPAVYRPGSHS